MSIRAAVIAVILGSSTAGLSRAAAADALTARPTNVQAEELGLALRSLARERGFQLVFQSEVVGNVRTRGASGDLTTTEALEQLLSDTGLTYRYLDDRTVTILPAGPPQAGRGGAPVRSPTPPRPGPVVTSDTSQTVPQVTVESPRDALEQHTYEFVRRITTNTRSYGEPLARWRAPLCFLVAGLPSAQGAFVLDRLSQIATSAGAALAPQNCHPNLLVVVGARPDQLLKDWFARSPRLLGDGPPAQTRSFLRPSHSGAVRVWYNVAAVGRDGMPLSFGGARGPPQHLESSRTVSYEVRAFSSVIVVVDASRLRDLKLGQIADYVAMVGLADVEPDADVADAQTVLQLFSAALGRLPQPAGLSAWDLAFLRAVYHADQSSLTLRSQIALRMVHDLHGRGGGPK